MPWIEIKISTSAEKVDRLETQLLDLGALCVTLQDDADQPIFEPDNHTTIIWQKTAVIGLFDYQQDMRPIIEYLNIHSLAFTLKEIPDEDWVRKSLDLFKPMCFGKKIWVYPSWHQPPDANAFNILIDPGLAFGTGMHPTTALCLQWLDQLEKVPETVIDYGCGSGILGIAALKLGAKKVLAIDHDEAALSATAANAEQNGIAPLTLTTLLPDQVPSQTADLLFANILAEPLITLSPTFAKLTHPGAYLVLSGILHHQVQKLIECYHSWFNMQVFDYKEEWSCLIGKRCL